MAARLAGVLADARRAQGVGGALRIPPPEVIAHLGGHRNFYKANDGATRALAAAWRGRTDWLQELVHVFGKVEPELHDLVLHI